jgi:LPS export ABC transporter protein LptC
VVFFIFGKGYNVSRNRLRGLILVLIVASLGGVGFMLARTIWAIKANELRQDPAKLLNQLPDAALEVKNFHRTKIENGRKAWELTGEEVRYLKAENQAVITKPRLTFYDKQGKGIEVSGAQGRLFLSNHEVEQMKLVGNIQLHYQGYVLETDEASFFKGKNQVVAPGKVTLKRGELYLEAVGMEIELDQERIRLLNGVKTRFDPAALENLERIADGRKKN